MRALAPVDIVVTKIGRLDARDSDDVRVCIKRFRLSRIAIVRRAKRVEYVGNQEVFDSNLETVTKWFPEERKPK